MVVACFIIKYHYHHRRDLSSMAFCLSRLLAAQQIECSKGTIHLPCKCIVPYHKLGRRSITHTMDGMGLTHTTFFLSGEARSPSVEPKCELKFGLKFGINFGLKFGIKFGLSKRDWYQTHASGLLWFVNEPHNSRTTTMSHTTTHPQ